VNYSTSIPPARWNGLYQHYRSDFGKVNKLRQYLFGFLEFPCPAQLSSSEMVVWEFISFYQWIWLYAANSLPVDGACHRWQAGQDLN
jgi:hypothetical protein